MKRQFKISILVLSFLSASLFFVGCERDFELKDNAEKRLVLLSSFTPDSFFSATISTSFPIGDNDIQNPDYSEDVEIQLFEDGSPVGNFEFINNSFEFPVPFYKSDFRPKENAEYTIKASLDGFPTATAINRIPSTISMNPTISLSIDSFPDYYYSNFFYYQIKAKLSIPEDSRNAKYFHLKVWRNLIDAYGYIYPKEQVETILSSTVEQTEILHESGNLFEGQVFVNHPDGIELDLTFTHDPFNEVRTPIYLELRHVSEDYFLFHKSIGQQEVTSFQTGLLANQSALIYNNIEDGIGNFGGYSIALDSIVW